MNDVPSEGWPLTGVVSLSTGRFGSRLHPNTSRCVVMKRNTCDSCGWKPRPVIGSDPR